jgi:hypothetical protein
MIGRRRQRLDRNDLAAVLERAELSRVLARVRADIDDEIDIPRPDVTDPAAQGRGRSGVTDQIDPEATKESMERHQAGRHRLIARGPSGDRPAPMPLSRVVVVSSSDPSSRASRSARWYALPR